MKKFLIMMLPFLLLLGGCAHWISEPSRALADRSISFSQLSKNPDGYIGKYVMLGGVIAAIKRGNEGTQIEVIQHTVGCTELPDESIHSEGRFWAATSVTLNPEKFEPGTLVSMVGEVTGKKTQSLQGREYIYPMIAIKEIRDIVIPQDAEYGYFGGM